MQLIADDLKCVYQDHIGDFENILNDTSNASNANANANANAISMAETQRKRMDVLLIHRNERINT